MSAIGTLFSGLFALVSPSPVYLTSNDVGLCIAKQIYSAFKTLFRALVYSVSMSDNIRQLQLAVLGFSDQPAVVGDVVGGNGPSAIHQRWFVLRDGQFHSAGPTGSDSDSDSDFDPNRQPNICFITVALYSGPVMAHHTEQLDACIDSSDMDQVASKVASNSALVCIANSVSVGTNATGQQPQQPQQLMASP